MRYLGHVETIVLNRELFNCSVQRNDRYSYKQV